jgi:DNA-binding IclR family transcriptional regulator
LGKTAMASLPMTELQANRINASLKGGTQDPWLSPRQLELLTRIEKRLKITDKGPLPELPIAIGVPITKAQEALAKVLVVAKRD